MKEFFSFLFSKSFLKHLVFAIIALFVVLWASFKLMSVYTHHGEVATVPDFYGKKTAELEEFVKDKNVRYEISDSIYDPDQKPGIVVKQDPDAKSEVKHNRVIYLYVTSIVAPEIKMPKLVNKSLRQALFMIESYGLKHGHIKEINADCNGCILNQLYKGKEIAEGAAIKKESKIDLIVGKKDNYYSIDTLSNTNSVIGSDDTD